MPEVVLIIPPALAITSYPSVGLGYLAAVLEQRNISVEIMDCPTMHYTQKQTIDILREKKPRIIGISVFTRLLPQIYELIGNIKEQLPDTLIVLGGGHFEGAPILPGIVQINELVLERSEAVWSDLGHLQRIARLKFQRIIGPGDTLQLELRRKQGTRELRFRIASGNNPCASGSLFFSAPQSA